MLALLAAAALTPMTYTFAADAKLGYDVEFGFSGYIPVMGGMEGTANVKLGFEVVGAKPDKDGNPAVTCELKFFQMTFNDADLPFTLDKVVEWFPKNTASITPQGKIIKNDLPDRPIPFRLPGIDVKRIPDITYLPIEFPVEGIEIGKEWTFKKGFGDADVTFTAKVTTLTDDVAEIEVKLTQSYDTLEDEAKSVVKEEKDAVERVHTDMSGTGKVTFDRKLAIVRSSTIDTNAVSRALDLVSKATTERKLKVTVKTTLRDKISPAWK